MQGYRKAHNIAARVQEGTHVRGNARVQECARLCRRAHDCAHGSMRRHHRTRMQQGAQGRRELHKGAGEHESTVRSTHKGAGQPTRVGCQEKQRQGNSVVVGPAGER